jgi:hypothetical protein
MRRGSRPRLVAAVFFMTAALGASAGASAASLGVYAEIVVYPFGWSTPEEAASAERSLKLDVGSLYQLQGDSVVMLAPFPGRFTQSKDGFVLQGHEMRIIYPILPGVIRLHLGPVDQGEAVLRYGGTSKGTLFFALAAEDSRYLNASFADGRLGLRVADPTDVYAMLAGSVSVIPSQPLGPDGDYLSIVLGSEGIDMHYLGLSELYPADGSNVPAGSRIGKVGRESENTYSISIQVFSPPWDELIPVFIYLEPLS